MAITKEEELHSELDILHPEILSIERLKELLQRSCSKINVQHFDKHDLVELSYKLIVPLPQRQYRNNRRGKLLNKWRKEKLKRKASDEERDSVQNSRLSHESSPNISTERLKPAPSEINFEKKIIKLSEKSPTEDSKINISSSSQGEKRPVTHENTNKMVETPGKKRMKITWP